MVNRVNTIKSENPMKIESNNIKPSQRQHTVADLRPVIEKELSDLGIKGDAAKGMTDIVMLNYLLNEGKDQPNKA